MLLTVRQQMLPRITKNNDKFHLAQKRRRKKRPAEGQAFEENLKMTGM